LAVVDILDPMALPPCQGKKLPLVIQDMLDRCLCCMCCGCCILSIRQLEVSVILLWQIVNNSLAPVRYSNYMQVVISRGATVRTFLMFDHVTKFRIILVQGHGHMAEWISGLDCCNKLRTCEDVCFLQESAWSSHIEPTWPSLPPLI
jgi:hypothetical protein